MLFIPLKLNTSVNLGLHPGVLASENKSELLTVHYNGARFKLVIKLSEPLIHDIASH